MARGISPITGLIYASVLNALLCWAAMIYLQVAHVQSAKFGPNYRALYGAYDKEVFDFESWACQVSSYKGTFPRGECRSAVAGRVISVLYCITIIGAVAVGTWALRREIDVIKRAKYEKRNRKEVGVGDSAAGTGIQMS
ncbi:hypothetical protein DM02DRAFT_631308 [Periconia macrospinosa]|uniref:Uncharacterized protein n=1 Tax=Periconia macrospinosa TaxID=97972 RepID=A0A2V1DGE1_9PLEO|nr:hypothetical protein DM02DRAFT_631308 [Periconia macrospinosa]